MVCLLVARNVPHVLQKLWSRNGQRECAAVCNPVMGNHHKCLSEAIFQERGSRVAARICPIEGRELSIGMAKTALASRRRRTAKDKFS